MTTGDPMHRQALTTTLADTPDFTEARFRALLDLASAHYRFEPFGTDCQEPHVLWRHDIDFTLDCAERIARIEAEAGLRATYFFMLTSIFYSMLEMPTARRARSLARMGHHVGLHFDAAYYADRGDYNIDAAVARERAILEDAMDGPISVMSLHNPGHSKLMNLTASHLGGLLNVYGGAIRRDYTYASDSNGMWRFQPIHEVLAERLSPRLHILTHPILWPREALPPRRKIVRCIETRAKLAQEAYDDLIKNVGLWDAIMAAETMHQPYTATATPPGTRAAIVSSDGLNARLDANRRFSSVDFHGWLQRHLAVQAGMDVLDVGCGTGAQSLEFLRRVGSGGSVSAADISAQSIERLCAQAGGAVNLQAEVADMMQLGTLVAERYRVRQYDLCQSTYALYYAKDPIHALDVMRGALKPGGRLAVCVPNNPHGLHEFLKRFIAVPAAAVASGDFGAQVLEPYFRAHFSEVAIHLLSNLQRVPTADDVMTFWRNTSYYDAAADNVIRAAVEREIADKGHFEFQKNSLLIIGTAPADTY